MQFLLFLTIFLTINADLLNEFTADVDYYDMGIMGRGKNAGSWHHSFENKEDVFYYLAMQPWRHLVWTRYDETEGEWYKYIINEDASNVPDGKVKLEINSTQDYCRKEYAHEMRKFEIDWDSVPQDSANFVKVDVNGETCYQYPGKLPLAYVYLDQQHTTKPAAENFKICRMEFIGGRSITFRSFNQFSDLFVSDHKLSGYKINRTRCVIDPYPNNLESDLSVVIGISDKTLVKNVLKEIKKLGDLTTLKTIKLYYLKGTSHDSMTLTKEELAAGTKFENLAIPVGGVEKVIEAAKNDLVESIVKNTNTEKRRKGTMVVLIDRSLSKVFDAETAFDRNDITVHVVAFNAKNDATFRYRATTLLSLGEHYHEFTSSTGLSAAMTNLFKGIRVNLTERCDRRKCNGFCDGRDRCTCPMCCENDCFYTYCDVDTATCTPWPKGNPKKKQECTEDCVGKRKCVDLQGCIIEKDDYNPGCAPPAKCLTTICNSTGGCEFQDTCGKDLVPSSDKDGTFRCWEYVCDEVTGMCRKKRSGEPCPQKTSLCEEYLCNEDLVCTAEPKKCVKTSPYIEMGCYAARCNERTGQCENKLKCDTYTVCAEGAETICDCNPSNFDCQCDTNIPGYCKPNEVCDTRWDDLGPICVVSKCLGDLRRDKENCRWEICNNDTKEHEWVYKDCSKEIIFSFDDSTFGNLPVSPEMKQEKADYCLSRYSLTCSNDKCSIVESTKSKKIFCGECIVKSDVEENGVRYITLGYKQDEYEKESECKINGNKIKAVCVGEKWELSYEGILDLKDQQKINEICAECIGEGDACSKDFNYREYKFDPEDGSCTRKVKAAASCTSCIESSGRFESTCFGEITKEHKTSDVTTAFAERTMTYTIPKTCMFGSQCVPIRGVDCQPKVDKGDGIYQIWQMYKGCNSGHDGYATGTYHYSDKFDETLFAMGQAQSDEFLAEAEQEAYCEWTLKTEYKCSTCDPVTVENNNIVFEWNDNCPVMKDGLKYMCNETESGEYKCILDPDVECPPKGCQTYVKGDGDGMCHKKREDLCAIKQKELDENVENAASKVIDRFVNEKCSTPPKCLQDCADGVCKEQMIPDELKNIAVEQSSCDYGFSDENCIAIVKQYERGEVDFGCYKPVAQCDKNTYRCKYAKIEKVEDDVDYYIKKSGVVKNNACYGYECVEELKDGKWTHEWRLKEEYIAKQNPQPRHKCETAVCNPETGEPKYTDILCDVNEQFPTLGGNQSECFYCQCSYTDGSFVLSMFADTAEKTYSLDACGSCIVTERETGKILNYVPECILKQELNLTGAIAGATVAASVVFALVGAMAVVSIGLFQTYQLVTSALKNAITTTVENAEFVAADNEATNVLNAGD